MGTKIEQLFHLPVEYQDELQQTVAMRNVDLASGCRAEIKKKDYSRSAAYITKII